MESQPQNPEFRVNPKNFHPCIVNISLKTNLFQNRKRKKKFFLEFLLYTHYGMHTHQGN